MTHTYSTRHFDFELLLDDDDDDANDDNREHSEPAPVVKEGEPYSFSILQLVGQIFNCENFLLTF